MKILFLLYAERERHTGPRNSVTLLVKHLTKLDNVVAHIGSVNCEEEFCYNDVTITPLNHLKLIDYDLVVFNGVWITRYLTLAKRLSALGIPYIISPRGSLSVKQIYKSFLKKITFLMLGGIRFIRRANKIHFLSHDEQMTSFSFGVDAFVSPNMYSGVVPFGAIVSSKRFGFLGRYSTHHKGLDILLRAIRKSKNEIRSAGWEFIFHGSDNRNEKSILDEYVRRHELEDIVKLNGPLTGDDKFSFLRSINIFVHTSRYEGQPQAVIEALCNGCALLVTPGSNMTHLTEKWAVGIVSEGHVDAISHSINRLMNDSVVINDMRSIALSMGPNYFSPSNSSNSFMLGVSSVLPDDNPKGC